MRIAILLLSVTAPMFAAEPEWGASRVKDCDRECLAGVMDGYMNAIYKHDPKAAPPLSVDVRMTENTGQWTWVRECCGDPKWSRRSSRFTVPIQ
jgi:hypothetical protein